MSSEVHEDKSCPASWIDIKQTWQHVHLCGMSFGTSISRDLIWRILMLPSIPLADTTSQANSYIVLESSQAYTSAAPAFLAHMLKQEEDENQNTDTQHRPFLALSKRIKNQHSMS